MMGVALLLLPGCKEDAAGGHGGSDSSGQAEAGTRSSACDEKAITTLSTELQAVNSWEAGRKVWPGLKEACSDSIPTPLAEYFRPFEAGSREIISGDTVKTIGEYKRKACPDIDTIMKEAVRLPVRQRSETVYTSCDFARYKALDRQTVLADDVGGLMAFTFHQWMLDVGIDEQSAQPITRALFTQKSLEFRASGLPDDFEMPVAEGVPLADGATLSVTAKGVSFKDKSLVNLGPSFALKDDDRKGGLVPRLFDELNLEADLGRQMASAREDEWRGELFVVADARTPYSTLADLFYTSGRAGLPTLSIVTARQDGGLGTTTVIARSLEQPSEFAGYVIDSGSDIHDLLDPTLPKPGTPKEKTPFLAIDLRVDGFSLSAPGVDEEEHRHAADELDAITKLAETVAKADGAATTVAISAEPTVPLSRLLTVLQAARGPKCTLEGSGCLLTEVHLVRTGALEYRPPTWPQEEDVWGGLTDDEIGKAYGVGGLGLVGTDRNPGEGTIGLGNTGLSGLVGDDDTNRGSGAGFGGRGKRLPKVRPGKHTVSGDLDREIVRRIVRAHINEVRSCYNTGLSDDPNLSGKIEVEFTVSSTGKVSESKVDSSTLDDEQAVAKCVAKAVKRWKFPKPGDGKDVVISYPYSLEPG